MAFLTVQSQTYDVGDINLTAYGHPFNEWMTKRAISDTTVKLSYAICDLFGTMLHPQDRAYDGVLYIAGGKQISVTVSPTQWVEGYVSISITQRYSTAVENFLSHRLTELRVTPVSSTIGGVPRVKIADLISAIRQNGYGNVEMDASLTAYFSATYLLSNGWKTKDGEKWEGVGSYPIVANFPSVTLVDFFGTLAKTVGGVLEITESSIYISARKSPQWRDLSANAGKVINVGRGMLTARANTVQFAEGWTIPQVTMNATRRDLPASAVFLSIPINGAATSSNFLQSDGTPLSGIALVPRPEVANNFVWQYYKLMTEGWSASTLELYDTPEVPDLFVYRGVYYQTVNYTIKNNKTTINAYRNDGSNLTYAAVSIDGSEYVSGDEIDVPQSATQYAITTRYAGNYSASADFGVFASVASYWILNSYTLTYARRDASEITYSQYTDARFAEQTAYFWVGNIELTFIRPRVANVATFRVDIKWKRDKTTGKVTYTSTVTGTSKTVAHHAQLQEWFDTAGTPFKQVAIRRIPPSDGHVLTAGFVGFETTNLYLYTSISAPYLRGQYETTASYRSIPPDGFALSSGSIKGWCNDECTTGNPTEDAIGWTESFNIKFLY